jgi:hypothetical protein
MHCSSEKAPCFGGTRRLHLQDISVSQARKQQRQAETYSYSENLTISEGSRSRYGPTGLTDLFVAVLGPSRHVLGRDLPIALHSPCFSSQRCKLRWLAIECSLAAWTHSLCGAKRWDVCESEIRMDLEWSISLLFLSTFLVLWHADPLLGNSCEISNYTTAVVN